MDDDDAAAVQGVISRRNPMSQFRTTVLHGSLNRKVNPELLLNMLRASEKRAASGATDEGISAEAKRLGAAAFAPYDASRVHFTNRMPVVPLPAVRLLNESSLRYAQVAATALQDQAASLRQSQADMRRLTRSGRCAVARQRWRMLRELVGSRHFLARAAGHALPGAIAAPGPGGAPAATNAAVVLPTVDMLDEATHVHSLGLLHGSRRQRRATGAAAHVESAVHQVRRQLRPWVTGTRKLPPLAVIQGPHRRTQYDLFYMPSVGQALHLVPPNRRTDSMRVLRSSLNESAQRMRAVRLGHETSKLSACESVIMHSRALLPPSRTGSAAGPARDDDDTALLFETDVDRIMCSLHAADPQRLRDAVTAVGTVERAAARSLRTQAEQRRGRRSSLGEGGTPMEHRMPADLASRAASAIGNHGQHYLTAGVTKRVPARRAS